MKCKDCIHSRVSDNAKTCDCMTWLSRYSLDSEPPFCSWRTDSKEPYCRDLIKKAGYDEYYFIIIINLYLSSESSLSNTFFPRYRLTSIDYHSNPLKFLSEDEVKFLLNWAKYYSRKLLT